LRIGVRDLLRLCPVEETLNALSVLAEALITGTYWVCASALRRDYGIPAGAFTGFTILAMGKLGGGELNFSSDVDLMYLYNEELTIPLAGTTKALPSSEYFHRLCQKITAGLNEFTSEGYVYRVDLRLRPEGKAGDIVSSLDGFKRYYETRLRTWERLALLKAWPVAGNRALGRAFLSMAQEFIYERPFDLKAVEDVRGMKRKIDREMAARQQQKRNVKLGTGGIREIELIAQGLEVRYGGQIPQLRVRNTLKSLSSLCDHSLISAEQCGTLSRAYIFLRDVENKLQMVHDAQTHSLPREQEELSICARLLGYSEASSPAAEQFLQDYRHHTGQVNRIFESIFSSHEVWRLSPAT
jgi:glutamate-ammonia-ligase adenylyltransferase